MVTEGVGFEPTVGCPTLDFESSALNRTQPPFRVEIRKRRTPAYAKKLRRGKRRTSNPPSQVATARAGIECNRLRDWAFGVGRWALSVCIYVIPPVRPSRQDCLLHEAKKCNNFRLATSASLTASCMSTRTATLLLVVDCCSQVLGAAVHQYSQLIRKPQPLQYRHDSTQTRNSARVTK